MMQSQVRRLSEADSDSEDDVSWRPSAVGILAVVQQRELEYLSVSLCILTLLLSELNLPTY